MKSISMTLNLYALAKIKHAEIKGGQEARRLLSEAEILLKKGGEKPYNMAGLYAIRGEEEQCRQWLELARRRKKLPTPDQIRSDLILANINQTVWFKDFLARVETVLKR